MRWLLGMAFAACGNAASTKDRAIEKQPGSQAAVAEPTGGTTCEPVKFADTAPVPEASAAAWLEIDGKPSLVVISDSGNDGAYVVLDPDDGSVRESGKLPLGGPGDDLEGLAVRGGKLVGLASPGWVRVWERKDHGFQLVDGPYPLAPVDLDKGKGNKPPKHDGMVCAQDRMNCGRNYEGLCLAPETKLAGSACVGFAASKADGHLYCLVERDGRLTFDLDVPAIEVAKPRELADCAFADDGRLFAGTNIYDFNGVFRIDGWRRPGEAKVTSYGSLGPGNSEVIAVRGDTIYRMSDTNGTPSLLAKYRCR